MVYPSKFLYLCIRFSFTERMNKEHTKKYLISAAVCVVLILGLGYYYFFSAFSAQEESQYLYIDADDNVDSVLAKLSVIGSKHGIQAFATLVQHSDYDKHIRTGRYEITPHIGVFQLFRHIKNGMQKPVNLIIPSVRTVNDLSREVGKKLMMDSTALVQALQNPDTCSHYGYTPETIMCLFIPNTYDIYWNVSIGKFLKRMQKENKTFWNAERRAKADRLRLTPVQVTILASIVDEETANNKEKPMIAGMYYNRLNFRDEEYPDGMPLQADPTIKFALKRFDLKRIYRNMLLTKSPYNTYTNVGLPPGPIRIPSVAGIDAVLNMVHHDYLYMCAKEDFSGTHNFARTYSEHLQNAARYAKALNSRGIQ